MEARVVLVALGSVADWGRAVVVDETVVLSMAAESTGGLSTRTLDVEPDVDMEVVVVSSAVKDSVLDEVEIDSCTCTARLSWLAVMVSDVCDADTSLVVVELVVDVQFVLVIITSELPAALCVISDGCSTAATSVEIDVAELAW